jgi:hypothetical protein
VPFSNFTDPSLAPRFVAVGAVSEVMASSILTLNSKCLRRYRIHGSWEDRKLSKSPWGWVAAGVKTPSFCRLIFKEVKRKIR